MKPILKAGDIFASENPMALGKIINFFQRNYNKDGKSKYTHAGLITNPSGISFEALWHYETQNIFTAYHDKEIVIFRNKYMNEEKFEKGWKAIEHLTGRLYPFYRLPLYIVPGFERFSIFKKPVCSELVAMFLYASGVRASDKSFGVDPDDLVDYCRARDDYEIVYEGNLDISQ